MKAVSATVPVPVIASGGASCAQHMLDGVLVGGADAVLAASIFHDGEITVSDLKAQISDLDVEGKIVFRNINDSSTTIKPTFDRARQHCIPSIDILDGQVVQLVGGDPDAVGKIICGDPLEVIKKFSLLGEVAVIDLNAARNKPMKPGTGGVEPFNRGVIKELARRGYRIRVGGGIRDFETGKEFLDAGVRKIIIGTNANPEFLANFPKERVIVALDNKRGELLTHGWQQKAANESSGAPPTPPQPSGSATLTPLEQKAKQLAPYCCGFLVTFVENEGRMTGLSTEEFKQRILGLKEAANESSSPPGSITLTIAGGITTVEDYRFLDALGCEGQIGMALYSGKISFADCVTAVLQTDRLDKLYPTIVAEQPSSSSTNGGDGGANNGAILGLCYSSKESIEEALESQTGVYFSRSRNQLWKKGETSGCVQKLVGVELDCDRDAIVFRVEQKGNFCHRAGSQYKSCFGYEPYGLEKLGKRLVVVYRWLEKYLTRR